MQAGDYGVQLRAYLATVGNVQNYNSAIGATLTVIPPSGSQNKFTRTMILDGGLQFAYYKTILGDIVEVGDYQFKVVIQYADGSISSAYLKETVGP